MSHELHLVFGTGQVGQALMQELIKAGKQVRMVSRSGLAKAPAGVEVVKGDATDTAFTTEAARGASVVYNVLNALIPSGRSGFRKCRQGY